MNNNIPKNVVQLITASREGNLACVQALLAKGLDPNSKDGDGWSPLMWAAMSGQEGVVELLLGHSDINLEARSQGGTTALLLAAAHGYPQVVQQLLARGADTALVDNGGYTPLMFAAMGGQEEVVALILSQPNINLEARSQGGRTALLMAEARGRVVKLLLQHGVDPAAVDNRGRTVLDNAAVAVITGYGARRDDAMEVMKYLVLEAGLPVTDEVRGTVAGDPEAQAICEQGRAEVRSLKQLARRAVWRLPREAQQLLPVTVKNFVNS